MDAKAMIDLLSKSKSTVNAIQALESIYDVVTDRSRPCILGPFSTPVAKAVSNQLTLMITRDPDALCSSYEAAISLKALCFSLAKSIAARASNAASLADVRLTAVQSGLMRSIVEACAELYQRVHEQSREVLQGRAAGEQLFTALCDKLKHTEEQILQLRTTQADAGPETEQQITQLELQLGQLLQQIGAAGEKYAPTPFVARYIVAGSLLRLWAAIATVWPDKQLLDSHFKPSLFHAAFLCNSVLTLATPVCDQYTRLSTPDHFTNAVVGALRTSVVQAAESACAYAAVVSKLAMQISETGQGPQFELALTQAPELASPAILHLLCGALAWTASLTQRHLTAAVADSSTRSQLPRRQQQQQQAPAHHAELLKVLGCCVLTKPEVRDIAGLADRQDYMRMAAIPHALAYCLALRQEEGLARRQGRPTSWPHQLEFPEESVPRNLYMPLARQCVEVLMLLDSPDVCFETVKLLYKICYYRGHWRPSDPVLKRSQLDFLLLEAAPALVGLVGDHLPKDKSSEAYKALDYFVDVLMRNAAHMVNSQPEFLLAALEQQQHSTCVMLEAAIRITATSNEPAIPQHALLQVVCACCKAAAINAQQQVAAAATGSAAGASQGACTPCDVADSMYSGATPGAAAAAGPQLPPELFSLLLSCVKFSTGLLMVLDANAATENVRNALSTVWGATGSDSSGEASSPATTALRVFLQGLRAGNPPGWHATWLRGSINVVSSVYTNNSSGAVRIKVADVASLAPWLHLIGRSLSALGQMIAMFDPAIHTAQGMRSSLSDTLAAKAVKIASLALQWLECILNATAQSLQQAAPQGQQDDSSSSSSSCSPVAQLPLTGKAAQQLLQDCKQLQQVALMYERLSGGNHSAKSRTERVQHAKAAETDLQQQLQQFGPALCAAVPLVYCCNNPECTKLTRVSERQAKGVCSKCKQARYCCNECQAAHWPLHKSTCKLLSKLMPTASNS